MKDSGATVGVWYLGYRETSVTTHSFRYDRFPPPANDWKPYNPYWMRSLHS
jgi:hypothetical protein